MENREQPQARPGIAGTMGVFNVFGVPIRLHFTFLLLLIILIVAGLGGSQSDLMYVLYIVALFASVIAHELGHAYVATRYGIRTIEIVMFPIGGLARLERNPRPREELWIALAGPFVNIVIAAGLFGCAVSQHQLVSVAELFDPTDANLAERIAAGNLILAGFNLLPAFPMDGGRVLRAILAMLKPEEEATRMAAWAGRMLAIGMGLYGLVWMHFMLVFVAFFVYLGAAQESVSVTGRRLTHGIPVQAAMVTEFHTLSHGSTIRDSANLLLATSQQDFPVVHGGRVVGLLGRDALLRAMAVEGADTYVAGAMERNFLSIPPGTDLAQVMPLMTQQGACALVMEDDRLLGMLTTDNLSQFLLLRRFGMEPAHAGG
ncbi:MAG: M50 family metallopeptidase [Bryobacteraceae bacterium]